MVMHIFFSGIGGTAIGPLAQIAHQAGYKVSGSDKQASQYIDYLKKHGITDIHIGQSADDLARIHADQPIDWFVYSSAVAIEQPDAPELKFCEQMGIKTSKRDEFLNYLIQEKDLKLVAVAGTHGKTTTTAMAIWLFKELGLPLSYSVGAKIGFGDMGEFNPAAEYFVLEADEFDRNFLSFQPHISLITGVDYDHQEIYPTLHDYQNAFVKFCRQSKRTVLWQEDAQKIHFANEHSFVLDDKDLAGYTLVGSVNRKNARLVVEGLLKSGVIKGQLKDLVKIMNGFPGLSRRFEAIVDHVYSDYAHTTEKIKGCLKTAFELSPNVVVVYEPLTNRRQHYIKEDYRDLFRGVKKLYWVPSYLAREDPHQHILTPDELIKYMANREIAEPALLDDPLAQAIEQHRDQGDLVVCISGGGGGSLDEWLRAKFA